MNTVWVSRIRSIFILGKKRLSEWEFRPAHEKSPNQQDRMDMPSGALKFEAFISNLEIER